MVLSALVQSQRQFDFAVLYVYNVRHLLPVIYSGQYALIKCRARRPSGILLLPNALSSRLQ